MTDPGLFLSNGSCYSAAGKRLDGSFIPCGNDAFGHKTCCGAGDNCLADNSCFGVHGSGYGSLLTYMAGCSDSDYKDASCPNKFIDQPWIALTLCDNSDGAWAVCSQEGNPATLRPGSFCSCTNAASSTVAFRDATVIPSVLVLPQSAGGSVSFFPGNSPTVPPAAPPPPATTAANGSGSGGGGAGGGAGTTAAQPTQGGGGGATTAAGGAGGATTTAAGGGDSTAGLPAPTQPPSRTTTSTVFVTSGGTTIAVSTVTTALPNQSGGSAPLNGGGGGSSSPGPNTGAKIGIGVGVAVGTLILLAGLLLLFLNRRRRQRRLVAGGVAAAAGEAGGDDEKAKQRQSATSSTPTASEADGKPVSEADGNPARPWSMRSELEGSPVAWDRRRREDVAMTGGAVGAGGVGGGEDVGGKDRLSPVAELPGSEAWHNENRRGARKEES